MSDGYEVGYGKPPKERRWPKGVSGNPGGREKGHKGLKTDLEAALNAVNTVENKLTGKTEKGRNQQLAIQRLVERAALGDLKAQTLLFPMVMQVLGAEDRHQGPRTLSSIDQQILAEVLTSRLAEGAPPPAGDVSAALPPPEASYEANDNAEGDDAPQDR